MLEDLRERPNFPSDFVWGTATAACHAEGRLGDAKRGESIWDRFCAAGGSRASGDTPSQGCDHYHRFREDVDLMRQLAVSAYRFSLAWPRIVPAGKGKADPEGLAFYDRLIEALLDADIEPFVTIYHGDLPQPLEDRGGWPRRDTAYYFAEYVAACAERFADRVKHWITINDPWGSAFAGYCEGTAAPGRKEPAAAWAALHHLLLGHAEGTAILRQVGGPATSCGISLGLSPVYAVGPGPDEERARCIYDAYLNRTVLDPILRGAYPEEVEGLSPGPRTEIRPGDLERIQAPLDFIGVNYYTCRRVTMRRPRGPIRVTVLPPSGHFTLTGWEIRPEGISEVVSRLSCEYDVKAIYVTENGAAFGDRRGEDGRIRDRERVSFLEAHLRELLEAISEGVPVKGYFVWSLLDGFQFQYGYAAPFGLVAVDREADFARISKDSFDYYATVIEANELP